MKTTPPVDVATHPLSMSPTTASEIVKSERGLLICIPVRGYFDAIPPASLNSGTVLSNPPSYYLRNSSVGAMYRPFSSHQAKKL